MYGNHGERLQASATCSIATGEEDLLDYPGLRSSVFFSIFITSGKFVLPWSDPFLLRVLTKMLPALPGKVQNIRKIDGFPERAGFNLRNQPTQRGVLKGRR
jgi:hypothetical protein